MKRGLTALIIVFLALSTFAFHQSLRARKNPYPNSVKSALEVQQTLMANELIEPSYPRLQMVVNIPARKVTLFDENQEVKRYDIAVGQPFHKTPTGPQQIDTLVWNPWWIPPNSPWAAGSSPDPPGPRNTLGPVKLLMGQGIRLHGTNRDSSVGRAASHGCLRMHNEEAIDLAWYIQKRMNNADDSLLEKYRKHNRRSFWIKLDHPVSVEIVYHPVEVRDNTVYIYANIYGWGRDVKTEFLDALMRNGIDLTKINAERVAELSYPKKRNEVVEIDLLELMRYKPRKRMSHLSD